MTLPTKEEAKRAAETLAQDADSYDSGEEHYAYWAKFCRHYRHAITLLKAYASGELVEREEPTNTLKGQLAMRTDWPSDSEFEGEIDD